MYEQNIKKLDVSEMLKVVHDWGSEINKFRVWVKLEGVDYSFFEINKDDCAGEVVCYAVGNNIERHLYVEHNVKDINIKVVEPHNIDLAEGTDVESEVEENDDDARKVRLGDSEDERTIALDNGFEVIEVDRPKEGAFRIENNGKSYRFRMCASKFPIKKSTPKKKKLKFIAPPWLDKDHKTTNSQRMADGDDQYESDESVSSNPNASEDEKCQDTKILGRSS